jgi:hypothetical protein
VRSARAAAPRIFACASVNSSSVNAPCSS